MATPKLLSALRLPPLPTGAVVENIPGPWSRDSFYSNNKLSILGNNSNIHESASQNIASMMTMMPPPPPQQSQKKKRGRGAASEAEKKQKKTAKDQCKLQKKNDKKMADLERLVLRLRRHMIQIGEKASTIDATVAACVANPDAVAAADQNVQMSLVDLCLLPQAGTNQIPLSPLKVPFDAFSFDGRFGISVLCMNTGRRDVPTLCRFNYVPPEDAAVLMGPNGLSDPSEAFLYPSLCAAAKRANLKPANGWCFFYVLVVWNERTYRVPLKMFQKSEPGGPGFIQRPGVEYTPQEINHMCKLASQIHMFSKEYLQRCYLGHVGQMGRHRPRDVIPRFIEPLLKVLPNVLIPSPTEPIPYGQWKLPPVSRDFCPTFVQFAS